MTPSSGKPLTILTTWAGCLYVIPSVHLQLRSCNCTHHPRKLHVKPWFLDVYHPKNKTHPWHPAQKSWVEPASALAISSLALIFNFCSNAWTGATIYQFGCLNLETPVITFAQMVVATNFGVQLDSKKHMGCHETLWRSDDFGGDFLSTNLQVWNHHQNDWTAIRAPTLFLGSSWE